MAYSNPDNGKAITASKMKYRIEIGENLPEGM